MATATVEREEFLERRRRFVGGSDAPSLFPEDSKYGCVRRLIYDKRGVPEDYPRTEKEQRLLERGSEMEEYIADRFAREYGFKVRRVAALVNKEHSFIGVNMDRRIETATTEQVLAHWPELQLEGECGPGYLECKTDEWNFRKLASEGIIPDYVFQVQHGLGVRGYKWGVMAVLQPSTFEMRVFPFAANKDLIPEIQRRAAAVWDIVQDRTKLLPAKPEFPDGNARCHGCQWRRTCLGEQALLDMAGERGSGVYEVDESYVELVSDLRDIRSQQQLTEETEKAIVSRIQMSMQAKNQSRIEVPSCGVRVNWSEQKGANRWDTRALEAQASDIGRKVDFALWIQEHHPELVAEFQKEKTKSPSLADTYKHPSAPTRPFRVVQL